MTSLRSNLAANKCLGKIYSDYLSDRLLDDRFWNRRLYDLEKFVHTRGHGQVTNYTKSIGKQKFSISLVHEKPKCSFCGKPLQLDSGGIYNDHIVCEKCNKTNDKIEAPDWVKVSTVKTLIGVIAESTAENQPSDKAQIKPISINCPDCAAAVKISPKDERVTSCNHCQAEFYIPDPIWKKLHPVLVVPSWAAAFSGTPEFVNKGIRQSEQRQKKQKEKEKKRAIAEERENRMEIIRSQIAEQRVRPMPWFWRIFASVMLGIFLVGFPIVFIKPVTMVFGPMLCDGDFSVSTYNSSSYNGQGTTTTYDYICRIDGVKSPMIFTPYIFAGGVVVVFVSLNIGLLVVQWFRNKKGRRLKQQLAVIKAEKLS